mgnify:CR=1 FL=1
MTWEEFQSEALSRFSITCDHVVIAKLALYEEMLLEYNEKVNLTAHRTADANREKNFLDSLAIAPVIRAHETRNRKQQQIRQFESVFSVHPSPISQPILPPSPNLSSPNLPISLLDLGTGAGFPGMILAIIFPEINVTLMDSIAKKTAFLTRVKEALKLTNVTIITAHAGRTVAGPKPPRRFEERRVPFEPHITQNLEPKRYDRMYTIVVARAVSSLSTLLPLMQPYVRRGGALIAMKGANLPNEIKDYEAVFGPIGRHNIQTYLLPSDTTPRSLFVMRNE